MKHPGKRLPANSLGVCKIEGCGKRAVAFHLCSTHYSKLNKYGDPYAGRTNDGRAEIRKKEKREQDKKPKQVRQRVACCVNGCTDLAAKLGWCDFHYGRNRAHGDPLGGGPRRIRRHEMGKCKVEGCDLKARSLHLCTKHLAKMKKYGDPLGGYVQDGRSKEWRPDGNGYISKFDPGNPYASGVIVFQHRFVIGESIGRPLRADESVHHKNGDRSDNRLSNLELWGAGQPAGQRVQDKVKWAREILKEYGHLF